MSAALIEQVQKHRKEIKHEVLTYALSELINMHRADPQEIEIQPEWQRQFRWSREQQTAFVESLILEVPIPPLFFFEENDGRWQLLDGLQRLSTILKFMSTEQDVAAEYQGEANNDHEWHYETQNDIKVPLQLVRAEYLPALSGMTFGRLPMSLRLNLKRARIQIYVLKRETDRMYKYEVFKRLNSGGADLEEQELRNCAVRLLDDKFPNYLRELAKDSNFLQLLRLSHDEHKRAEADELALRFLTMKNYGQQFRHDVKDLLTQYMEAVAKQSEAFDYEKEKTLFEETWSLLAKAYADGKAFQARRADGSFAGAFSPAQFEMISLAVACNLEKARAMLNDELRTSLDGLVAKAKEDSLSGAGSNSRKKTLGRLKLARSWLA